MCLVERYESDDCLMKKGWKRKDLWIELSLNWFRFRFFFDQGKIGSQSVIKDRLLPLWDLGSVTKNNL